MSVIPDYVERKGSLFLRSNDMNYSRAILNSNWHQARESEPKDNDISKSDVRDLCKATYNRIGDNTDGSLPITTYQDMNDQLLLKKEFEEKESHQHMVNDSNAAKIDLERRKYMHRAGHDAVLPSHSPEHNKFYLNTTHRADFKPPYPYTPAEEKPEEFIDYTMSNKRCLSQFSDVSNHRRSGRNTWHDESGLYANSIHKAENPVYSTSNPIPSRLL